MYQNQANVVNALLRISEAIAEPDDYKRLGHSHAKLIQILLDLLPARSERAGLLWLVDRERDCVSATLWVAVNATSEPTASAPAPLRVNFNNTRYQGIRGIKDPSSGLSIKNPKIAEYVSSLLRVQRDWSEFFLPLSISSKEDWPLAFVHILSDLTDLSTFFPMGPSPSFVSAVSKALAYRIASGREQRINAAITEFQRLVAEATTSYELIQSTSKLLLDFASAVSCVIFKRHGRNGLELVAEASHGYPSPRFLSDESFTSQVFRGSAIIEAKSTQSLRLSSFSEQEKVSPSIRVLLPTELPDLLTVEKTSWLSYVIGCPSYRGSKSDHVPLILIRLLTTQREGFLGGAFSATDEVIVTRIGDYLGELLPGLLLQEAMTSMGEEAPTIQNQIRDRIARSEILQRERAFASVISRLVPSVQEVFVSERKRKRDGNITGYWSVAGKSNSQASEFVWPKRLRFDGVKRRPDARKGILDIYLYELDDRELGLRCYLDQQDDLPEYEWKIIEYIVGELRFAALGALDLSEKTVQIAELRHALRAGLTGLLGHLKVATDLYSDTSASYRDGLLDIAIRRTFQEAQFRKSLERARLSGEQVSAFFEDTRVLLADITKESLQKTSFDPTLLVDELRTLFLTEVIRRRLTLSTEQILSRPIVYDRALLKLALFNLIDNAVKYSFSENVITIVGEYHRGQYQFMVQNVGPLIPPGEVRDQIFEPFRRIRHAGVQAMPGTGLGLAATRRIAEVHSGSVRVESTALDASHGIVRARTAFTLLIPHE